MKRRITIIVTTNERLIGSKLPKNVEKLYNTYRYFCYLYEYNESHTFDKNVIEKLEESHFGRKYSFTLIESGKGVETFFLTELKRW